MYFEVGIDFFAYVDPDGHLKAVGKGNAIQTINSSKDEEIEKFSCKNSCGVILTITKSKRLVHSFLPKVEEKGFFCYQFKESYEKTIKEVKGKKFKDCFTGIKSEFFVDTKGVLFGMGENYGNLGNGEIATTNSWPSQVYLTLKKDETIKDLQTGREFSVLLTSKGRVFVSNEYTCLFEEVPYFKKKQIFIEQISCGNDFCLFLSNFKKIYSTGLYGLSINAGLKVCNELKENESLDEYDTRKISHFFYFDNKRIKRIEAGGSIYNEINGCCFFISEDFSIYCFGDNSNYSVGIKNNEIMKKPELIKDKNIIDAFAGDGFSIFLKKNNNLYISGIVNSFLKVIDEEKIDKIDKNYIAKEPILLRGVQLMQKNKRKEKEEFLNNLFIQNKKKTFQKNGIIIFSQ